MHRAPFYSSWLHQVDLWFGKIERDGGWLARCPNAADRLQNGEHLSSTFLPTKILCPFQSAHYHLLTTVRVEQHCAQTLDNRLHVMGIRKVRGTVNDLGRGPGRCGQNRTIAGCEKSLMRSNSARSPLAQSNSRRSADERYHLPSVAPSLPNAYDELFIMPVAFAAFRAATHEHERIAVAGLLNFERRSGSMPHSTAGIEQIELEGHSIGRGSQKIRALTHRALTSPPMRNVNQFTSLEIKIPATFSVPKIRAATAVLIDLTFLANAHTDETSFEDRRQRGGASTCAH